MNQFFYVPLLGWWGEVTYYAVPVRMGREWPGMALDSTRRLALWLAHKTGFD